MLNDVTSLKQQEQELEITSKLLNNVLSLANLNVWQYDLKSDTMILMNLEKDSFIDDLIGDSKKQKIIIENYQNRIETFKMIGNKEKNWLNKIIMNLPENETFEYEMPVMILPDQPLWIYLAGEVIYNQAQEPIKIIGYFKDITLEKSSFRQHLENEKTLKVLTEKSFYDISVNLTKNRIVNMNMRDDINEFTSDCYSDYIKTMVIRVVKDEYQDQVIKVLKRENIIERYYQGIVTGSAQYERIIGSHYRWMEITYHILDIQENGEIYCYIYIIDIDKQKRREISLLNRAQRDGLTGFYNRATAIKRIETALNNHHAGALLMLDMDNFKQINDRYGHLAGDEIIVKTAQRLKKLFAQDDIMCRIGGDELMIFCLDIDETALIMKLEKVSTAMKEPYQVNDQHIYAPLSIGFVMVSSSLAKFDELYQKADIALYQAKQDGLAKYRMYQED